MWLLSGVFGKLLGYSVEVLIGCKEYPYFVHLTCVLEVCLLGTAWFGTHPLLLQIFVGYEPEFL